MKPFKSIYLLFFLTLISCAESVTSQTKSVDVEQMNKLMQKPIREIVVKYYPKNFYIGTANHSDLIGKLSTEIADREFSYITPSNDFKQSYIHRDLNKWRWAKPDAYVKHALKKNQVLRVHGPISPQCSPWVREDNRTPEELSRMLDEYMIALCKRYNGVEPIIWMDVVNETICRNKVTGLGAPFKDMEAGDWFGPRKGTEKWENPWTQIGYDETTPLRVPLYIDRAFELANEYAPDIKQIINQHGDFEPIVWEKVKKLVHYLREVKHRRVDGLGWQAHIDMGWEKEPGRLEYLDKFIKWCHANDLEFHITEMNVWMKDEKNHDEAAQAKTFSAVLDVLLNNIDSGVVGLNFWNVRDEDTGNPNWAGTLWKNSGEPREAYFSIKRELINHIGDLKD